MAFSNLHLGQKLVIGGIIGTCTVVLILNGSSSDIQQRRRKDMNQLISSGQVAERAFRVVDGQFQIAQPLQNVRPSFAPRPFFENTWTPKFILQNLVLNRTNLQEGRWYTLLTSGFSHGGFVHLYLNMSAFLSLAPSLLGMIGTPAFLGIWIASGVVGGAASIWGLDNKLKSNLSRLRIQHGDNSGTRPSNVNFLGASASILGLFAAKAIIDPRMRVGVPFVRYSFSGQRFMSTFFLGSILAEYAGWLPWIGHLGHAGGIVVGAIAGYAIKRTRNPAMMLPLLLYSISKDEQPTSGGADTRFDNIRKWDEWRATRNIKGL